MEDLMEMKSNHPNSYKKFQNLYIREKQKKYLQISSKNKQNKEIEFDGKKIFYDQKRNQYHFPLPKEISNLEKNLLLITKLIPKSNQIKLKKYVTFKRKKFPKDLYSKIYHLISGINWEKYTFSKLTKQIVINEDNWEKDNNNFQKKRFDYFKLIPNQNIKKSKYLHFEQYIGKIENFVQEMLKIKTEKNQITSDYLTLVESIQNFFQKKSDFNLYLHLNLMKKLSSQYLEDDHLIKLFISKNEKLDENQFEKEIEEEIENKENLQKISEEDESKTKTTELIRKSIFSFPYLIEMINWKTQINHHISFNNKNQTFLDNEMWDQVINKFDLIFDMISRISSFQLDRFYMKNRYDLSMNYLLTYEDILNIILLQFPFKFSIPIVLISEIEQQASKFIFTIFQNYLDQIVKIIHIRKTTQRKSIEKSFYKILKFSQMQSKKKVYLIFENLHLASFEVMLFIKTIFFSKLFKEESNDLQEDFFSNIQLIGTIKKSKYIKTENGLILENYSNYFGNLINKIINQNVDLRNEEFIQNKKGIITESFIESIDFLKKKHIQNTKEMKEYKPLDDINIQIICDKFMKLFLWLLQDDSSSILFQDITEFEVKITEKRFQSALILSLFICFDAKFQSQDINQYSKKIGSIIGMKSNTENMFQEVEDEVTENLLRNLMIPKEIFVLKLFLKNFLFEFISSFSGVPFIICNPQKEPKTVSSEILRKILKYSSNPILENVHLKRIKCFFLSYSEGLMSKYFVRNVLKKIKKFSLKKKDLQVVLHIDYEQYSDISSKFKPDFVEPIQKEIWKRDYDVFSLIISLNGKMDVIQKYFPNEILINNQNVDHEFVVMEQFQKDLIKEESADFLKEKMEMKEMDKSLDFTRYYFEIVNQVNKLIEKEKSKGINFDSRIEFRKKIRANDFRNDPIFIIFRKLISRDESVFKNLEVFKNIVELFQDWIFQKENPRIRVGFGVEDFSFF
ncbi:hypothetical protein M0811_10807 [Anaeramoeba ignava]|uniref:Uncharacterized protein n=1 Tax=Anaeramoeba ignava TaxID=1746090 RepID=A0A9Q0LFG8_ANAIG|nr:hypothetical protein M0811_10807 [Anaeramoeba ignava]